MGSSFFGKVGAKVAPAAQYLQYVSPGAHDALKKGQAYTNSLKVPFGPTPFAGVKPTLQDANNGYMPRTPMPAAPVPGVAPNPALPFQPPLQQKPLAVGTQPVGQNPWGRY